MKNFPQGFQACAVHSGIGKKKSKPDLAVFYSETPCDAAAVFTLNRVKAAPVLLSRETLKRGKPRAIVVNSGCANACTGERGMKDARETLRHAVTVLKVPAGSVLSASTGVIGEFLPMRSVEKGLQVLADKIFSGESDPLSAVHAMMTTDTVPKFDSIQGRAGGKPYRIWGCVKGAGMIHPNMATMLSFILTDAQVPQNILKRSLKKAVDVSFNCVSVDGDTSTNDTVFLLANGSSGARAASSKDFKEFEDQLMRVCVSLAKQMASDGEGATKRVEIHVTGAKSDAEAKKAAATIATSPLVKTAMYGNDANWGRVLAALGRSGAQIVPEKVKVSFGGMTVLSRGTPVQFSESRALAILKEKVVPVRIDLGQGRGRAHYFTCDFSLDYVKINAEYRT